MKRYTTLLWALILVLLPSAIKANSEKNIKTLLIINSYHEDELWANNMTRPVELFLAKVDSVTTERVYLNNSSVRDRETYDLICDNIFSAYADRHPAYVVLVGNFAFNLRDRIKAEWGDIPFLLISRIETFSTVEHYFANTDADIAYDLGDQIQLGTQRSKYNFTAVIVPDYYQENLELMKAVVPDMKEFVFVSDKAFVNKMAAVKLEALLSEIYPDIKFRWLQGEEKNGEILKDLLIRPHPHTGILMSSWVYEITNPRGLKVLTTRDLTYLSAAVNPVFTLRQHYMRMGCLGGAFSASDTISENITNMVEAMLRGENMKTKPFLVPESPVTCVNYNLMSNYGLDFKALPKGTVVLNKPETYFEKYWVLMISVLFVCVIIIFITAWRNKTQRHRISILERHTGFINNLPMPYTKASLWFDGKENVINITYEVKNKAYDELISKNSLPDNPLHLFSNSFMNDIAHKLLSTGEPVNVRHHFKRTGVYCYFIFVPFNKDEIAQKKKGEVIQRLDIDVFAIDVTKDHMMQQQLKDQAITIDISMEMAQLLPWQWDAESDTLSFYANRDIRIGKNATTTTDGKSTSTMKIDEFLKLMPPADAERMMKSYSATLRGECMRVDAEYRLKRNDAEDTYEWCESHGVVTDTDSDGRPLRMTGSLQFITDRKRQEEEIQQALTKAKESDMLKSAFLANMSHEIRTPLNAIVGFSNLLTNTDDPTERVEFANIINSNNELLLSLINDILDLAKIESNTITLTYDLCDIHDVVDSISKTVSIRVPKGVKLNVAHYADSCVVKADAGHVSQILINLLTNATKFTKRGSITVGYEIIEDDNKLYFYVKDTGIGIKKENIEKVFNRFVKLNNFVQGSGLGLAICRTLVEKMGGEIGVESAGEGRGSTFWFTIPYDPMDLKTETEAATEVVRQAVPADHIVGEHADRPAKVTQKTFEFKTASDISNNMLSVLPNGLTVLIAEDNPSNYWLMERLMKDKFNLHHAENGQIALDMLDEIKPDIIIMDINMPELDGYGAVEQMRKRGVTVPIIAVTAYAFASDRIRILNSGFDAFVSKPVSASILFDTITDVWERKKMKGQIE